MSAFPFDPDALIREVRATAGLSLLATTATSLRNEPRRSDVANVAAGGEPDVGAKRSDVASVAVHPASEPDETAVADAIEERKALAADRVPAVYLDAWARLNCQKPEGVSESEWWLACHNGGLFLDAFGGEAARLGWRPGELFDPGDGLVWRLADGHARAIAADRVWLSDHTIVLRLQTRGFR